MKYIIYCRKSTDTEDKQVLSLESQENELKRLAEAQGFEVMDVLRESKSAKEPGRPIFNEMMNRILSGEIDAILCWKIDRLTRNPVDGGQIQWLLQKEKIKCITTFEKSYFPNDNVLIMSIEQAMANQYIRDLSMNVKRGNRAKLERGEWPNHAPFGYVNDKATKKVKINTKKEKYVKRTYELYATGGYTLQQISDVLYEEGLRTSSGKKVFKNQIHRILTNPFYAGLMKRHGVIYQGTHKAIVKTKLFDDVQAIFENRLHPRPKKHFYSARGFLTCTCGCAITADTKKGHQYYYCTNGKSICSEHKRYTRSEEMDKIISKVFLEFKIDEELIEISAEAYKQKMGTKIKYSDDVRKDLLEALKSLDSKESLLTDSFISQIIKKPLYEEKMKELNNERVTLKNQLDEFERNNKTPESTFEQIKNIFIEANKASKQYLEVKDDAKRRMLEKLLSNIKIENQNVAYYQFKSPYSALLKASKNPTISNLLGYKDSNLDTQDQNLMSYH